jgi:hypothetical protein
VECEVDLAIGVHEAVLLVDDGERGSDEEGWADECGEAEAEEEAREFGIGVRVAGGEVVGGEAEG